MQRQLAIPILAVLLVGVLGISWGLWAWVSTRFAVRAYERIQLGMTPTEVASAIGLPPGFYDDIGPMPGSMSPTGEYVRESGVPKESLDEMGRSGPERFERLRVERWFWENYWIWVAYDEMDKVVGYYLLEVSRHPWRSRTFFDRLRACVGL